MVRTVQALMILMATLLGPLLRAQGNVQTIVPRHPIFAGDAFQVQYVVEDVAGFQELLPPAFGKNFRFISGPRIYKGFAMINGARMPIQNFSYTLLPLQKGRLQVKGATAVYKKGIVPCPGALVTIVDPQPGSSLSPTGQPNIPVLEGEAEQLEQKLRGHLLIRAEIDKKACFVGEPVVATFTLFSRVQSASQVVKNPGFYGFSVVDVPGEPEQHLETINGNSYTAHLLRKVQLYPLQAGRLVIDEMTVDNAVEFMDAGTGENREAQFQLVSHPLTVEVKPLPAKGRPAGFTGAVGNFSIEAALVKPRLALNESGRLWLTINGRGNFLQLDGPPLHWPVRVEGNEPTMTEQLRNDQVPVTGNRLYEYTFTADSPGQYTLPPLSFSYFHPPSKSYRTITTDTLQFTVGPPAKGVRAATGSASPRRPLLWLLLPVLLAVVAAAWLLRKKKPAAQPAPPPAAQPVRRQGYAEQVLAISAGTPAAAYRELQQAIRAFLKDNYGQQAVAGQASAAAATASARLQELHMILQECEVVQYYAAEPSVSFNNLQVQAVACIRELEGR